MGEESLALAFSLPPPERGLQDELWSQHLLVFLVDPVRSRLLRLEDAPHEITQRLLGLLLTHVQDDTVLVHAQLVHHVVVLDHLA